MILFIMTQNFYCTRKILRKASGSTKSSNAYDVEAYYCRNHSNNMQLFCNQYQSNAPKSRYPDVNALFIILSAVTKWHDNHSHTLHLSHLPVRRRSRDGTVIGMSNHCSVPNTLPMATVIPNVPVTVTGVRIYIELFFSHKPSMCVHTMQHTSLETCIAQTLSKHTAWLFGIP